MIISHKHKFLFIGLPFSASSAITKELCGQYAGKPYLRKHSLYHEFIKKAKKEELKYFVFSVIRNPMEIAVTIYLKMKNNPKGNYTNPKLYKENGGHISKKQREKFEFIQSNKATFEEFFLKFYTKPYENFTTLTLHNSDFVIRYENLENGYIEALRLAGIESPNPLPVLNKTVGKTKDIRYYYTEKIKKRAIYIFGPFFKKYDYKFPKEWGEVHISKFSIIHFRVLGFMRRYNEKYFKKYSFRKSIRESVYGKLQRKLVK
jgi:hypothetical protein